MELGNYKCSGKKYNGEKAIISLTSWKARINTVSKTLYSLLKMCPGFHIVLVLSEEEFPKMENEMPSDLMLLVNGELVELLWIYPNIRSFKKALPTMDKYREVPVISADDGQAYYENFAEHLYKRWLENKSNIVSKTHFKYNDIDFGAGGRGICYPPYCFGKDGLDLLTKTIVNTNHDDAYIGTLAKKKNINFSFIDPLNRRRNNFFVFKNDEKVGLTNTGSFNNKNAFEYFIKKL